MLRYYSNLPRDGKAIGVYTAPLFMLKFRRAKFEFTDDIEAGITDDLVAAGVPKYRIVLAFHPPRIRERKGYSVD